MDSDGTQDARGTHANPVPRPAGPADGSARPYGGQQVPARPAAAPKVPPAPQRPPRTAASPAPPASPVADWLNEPRPAAGPGVWRFGHRPPKAAQSGERLSMVTIVGVLVPLVVGLVLWSLWRDGRIPYQWALLRLFTPDDWWWGGTTTPKGMGVEAVVVGDGVFFGVLVYAMGRLGSWSEIVRHVITRRDQPARALISALCALAALSLVFPGAFPLVGWDPLPVVDPVLSLVVLVTGGYGVFSSRLTTDAIYTVITLLVLWPFARTGGWWALVRERLAARERAAAAGAAQVSPRLPRAYWPELRDAGQVRAAETLTAEVLGGRMNDVDCARVDRAWDAARAGARLADFTGTVLRDGAAAWTHPSGDRDLPARAARHDLLERQVRIGRWTTGERTPAAYRGAGTALAPEALGTSLLLVGPPGSGKTRHVVAPVVESLALQALTGGAAVVAVCAAGTALAPDRAFDVVIRVGDRDGVYDLDPYAGSEDPDEAAGFLAEALAGDLDSVGAQRAATAVAQLLGPYRAVYGVFPTLPVLRELLEGDPAPLAELRAALAGPEHAVMRRELDARARQAGGPADPGPALADRLALLDRPAFAGFLGAGGAATRPFSLHNLAHHPLRVRVDLPAHGHEEACRLITRLVLAQFGAVTHGTGRRHFACLVLDDATGTVTAESVRRVQRLRSQNAGVLLSLRTLGDVPEALHGPLLGAVGCRMALAGVTTWDGSKFAHAWGTEWVETRDVAQHTVFADQPMTRAIHALRKLITGRAVTTEAVTVRQVERERWSASELAHAVPPGHAVLSLTTVDGEHAPPSLVDLRATRDGGDGDGERRDGRPAGTR
ncbi:ATP/GTP-binding protein [Streptomyces sp. NPDC008150]|uniref:ATP/GTP-binding protein n=1 Tax=Streptomyces sp. NPDC008150 TaxID=3364816 RepID=UPI0036E2C599